MNTDEKRKMRDDAEMIVQDQYREIEKIKCPETKALRSIDASVMACNRENWEFEAKIAKLKSGILARRPGKSRWNASMCAWPSKPDKKRRQRRARG